MRPSHYLRYKKHFCSAKCYGLSERGKNNPVWKDNLRICPICGKKFKPTRLKGIDGKQRYTIYCSRICAQRDKSKQRSKLVKCVICGMSIKVINARLSRSNENCCSLKCSHRLHSQRMRANGNSNWRGGIGNLPWHYQFNKELKARIKRRDGDCCRLCGLRNNDLRDKRQKGYGIQIHHIDYNKQNNDDNNLISLCNFCHGKVNYNKKIWQPKLSNLLKD